MLLRREGIGPSPRRGPAWRQFLKAQASGIIACDFFTVESAFLKTLYVLFFIDLGSRRVYIGPATTNPARAADPGVAPWFPEGSQRVGPAKVKV